MKRVSRRNGASVLRSTKIPTPARCTSMSPPVSPRFPFIHRGRRLSLCLSLSPFLVQCNFKLIMHRTTPAVGSRRVIFRQFTPSWPKEAANKPASISRHAIPRTRYLWYPELGLPSAYTCITHACGAHGSLEHRGDSPLCRHRGRISILTHFAESTPID